MAAVTFAVLLGAVSASVRSDLEHLGSCIVTDALVVAQCKALLQGLNSNTKGLREACKTADITRKRNGRLLNQEELRELFKTKLLNLWPAQHFVNLDVQISWQAQHCVNLDVQISWQAQRLLSLEVQISWQVQHFVNLDVQIS